MQGFCAASTHRDAGNTPRHNRGVGAAGMRGVAFPGRGSGRPWGASRLPPRLTRLPLSSTPFHLPRRPPSSPSRALPLQSPPRLPRPSTSVLSTSAPFFIPPLYIFNYSLQLSSRFLLSIPFRHPHLPPLSVFSPKHPLPPALLSFPRPMQKEALKEHTFHKIYL